MTQFTIVFPDFMNCCEIGGGQTTALDQSIRSLTLGLSQIVGCEHPG